MTKKQVKQISQVSPVDENGAAKSKEAFQAPKPWEDMSYQEILKLSQEEIDKIIELMSNEPDDEEEDQSMEGLDLEIVKGEKAPQESVPIQKANPLKLKKLGLGEVSAYGAPYGCDTSTHLTYSC